MRDEDNAASRHPGRRAAGRGIGRHALTAEVLAQGDERRSAPGRAVGVAMLAALLAIGGVAIARARSDAAKQPRAGWTEYPFGSQSPVPIDDGPVYLPAPNPFAESTTAALPKPGAVTSVLLAHDEPAFLVASGDEWRALVAFGGPVHAPVLVGWCASSKTFQDASGTYVYDDDGYQYGSSDELTWHEARVNGKRIQIAGTASPPLTGRIFPPRAKPPRCPEALRYPTLPERVDDVHDTVDGFRVVRGRYVVTTESASFCAPVGPRGCAAQGWEQYHLGSLPGWDLASGYTWEGDFVVHGNRGGSITAARLPGVRLVERTAVGSEAVHGVVSRVVSENPLVLRVSLMDRNDAKGLRGATGKRDVEVRADAAVFLGNGITGLGLPRGNPKTLRDYLDGDGEPWFWFVLDANGRAMRVIYWL